MIFNLILLFFLFGFIYACIVIPRDMIRAKRRKDARKAADRIIRDGESNQGNINRLIDVLGMPVAKAKWGQVKEADHERIERLRKIRNRE